jgi:hypothetical protein
MSEDTTGGSSNGSTGHIGEANHFEGKRVRIERRVIEEITGDCVEVNAGGMLVRQVRRGMANYDFVPWASIQRVQYSASMRSRHPTPTSTETE